MDNELKVLEENINIIKLDINTTVARGHVLEIER